MTICFVIATAAANSGMARPPPCVAVAVRDEQGKPDLLRKVPGLVAVIGHPLDGVLPPGAQALAASPDQAEVLGHRGQEIVLDELRPLLRRAEAPFVKRKGRVDPHAQELLDIHRLIDRRDARARAAGLAEADPQEGLQRARGRMAHLDERRVYGVVPAPGAHAHHPGEDLADTHEDLQTLGVGHG
jgi:hypothetical protein